METSLPHMAVVLLVAAPFVPAGLFARADLRGRLDLDYARTDIREMLYRQFNQTLELSATDDLLRKNLLTLGYFLERFSGVQEGEVIRQRWRGTVVGDHYTFTGEFLPRYRLRGTSGSQEQHATGRRFTLTLSPPKLPAANLSYERNERMGGEGTGEVNIVEIDRLAGLTYARDFMNYRALLRQSETKSKVQFGQDRRIRDVNAGVGANVPLPRNIRMSADYDFLYTEDKGGPQTESETMVNNVGTQGSIRPAAWLHGYATFLGNYVVRTGEGSDGSSLSEVISGVDVTPVGFLRISASRDYRRVREDDRLSISDFLRARAVVQGRVRERVQGRATFTRTFVLRNVEGSFPSQGVLFNLNGWAYRGVVLNADINIIHSRSPDGSGGQFQVRRVLDLRMIPTRRVTLNTSAQTLSFGRNLPWFDSQTYTLEFDVNYQPSSRLTTVFTLARKVDRVRIHREDFIFTGTLNYQFRSGSNLSILYNRRGGGNESGGDETAGAASFTSAQQGVLVQVTMKLRDRAVLRATFDTRHLPDGERMEIIGLNFIKWF